MWAIDFLSLLLLLLLRGKPLVEIPFPLSLFLPLWLLSLCGDVDHALNVGSSCCLRLHLWFQAGEPFAPTTANNVDLVFACFICCAAVAALCCAVLFEVLLLLCSPQCWLLPFWLCLCCCQVNSMLALLC